MDINSLNSDRLNADMMRTSQLEKNLQQFEKIAGNENISRKKKIDEAAEGFESMFVNMMLSQMRKSIPKSDLLGNTPGKEIFEEMFDQEISKKIAQRGGLGIADALKRTFEEHYARQKPQNTGDAQ
ncbi:MAG: rod-binding protein [Candidatus Auribacterota bacterium]|jgi:Rod binding domain-containing protein|uniref:Flagellar protein FlgJ N-terminal domain-containing protein n=1 Tax=Candidatus Auribacter fodinae TaxID=2093366 RepID=A0A3A4RAK2_9BACT|nr:MAG: hypothetical protein C4541_01295 [Candidatus Auribacter fodinae]